MVFKFTSVAEISKFGAISPKRALYSGELMNTKGEIVSLKSVNFIELLILPSESSAIISTINEPCGKGFQIP